MKLQYFILLFAILSTACGNQAAGRKISSLGSVDCVDSSCDGSGGGPTDGGTFAIRTQKVEGVISQRQLLPNFQKCLNLQASQISATSKAAYKESIPSLSLEGQAKDVSAPMLMAITKVASEMCLDLINVEKNSTNRKYFPGFTLGGSTANTQSFSLSSTLNTLGNACWGRNLTSAEASIISTELGTRKDLAGALFACTAILSSAQAIRY